MRPHPGAHTHWFITRKYPPPMGATSSRPYPGGHIPIGLLLGRTPPPPPTGAAYTSSQKRGGEGGRTKKYTWKGTPTLRGVSNIPTVNLFG